MSIDVEDKERGGNLDLMTEVGESSLVTPHTQHQVVPYLVRRCQPIALQDIVNTYAPRMHIEAIPLANGDMHLAMHPPPASGSSRHPVGVRIKLKSRDLHCIRISRIVGLRRSMCKY
ncbi:hypothetical protein TWF706_000678 [Orbilia oligospora]|nr:hypothetical protein TWF706_000678 [Orbilia oligospora]